MKKIIYSSLALILILGLSGCTKSPTNSVTKTKSGDSDSIIENKVQKFKEKDAGYLGSDEFGKDLEEMSDELYANAVDKGGYTSKEEEIWKYCRDRWEYYDRLEGDYSGDKYTENVFQDAAVRFNITSSEAKRIWEKVDGAKLGL